MSWLWITKNHIGNECKNAQKIKYIQATQNLKQFIWAAMALLLLDCGTLNYFRSMVNGQAWAR